MQTFLPYPNFVETAKCLDDTRLLNQRNEAQIICAHIFPVKRIYKCKICWDRGGIPECRVCGVSYKAYDCYTCRDLGVLPDGCPTCGRVKSIFTAMTTWRNHPAVHMWRLHRWALLCYSFCICEECVNRGFKDTVATKLKEYGNQVPFTKLPKELLPQWLGNVAFHQSHQSNLLRKNPQWYHQFKWNVPNDMPYLWP